LLIAILVKDVTVILTKLWGYILVLIAFVGFVIYNRGIVVGKIWELSVVHIYLKAINLTIK